MSPALRKVALIAHIAVSVGWIGAAMAYLALVAAAQTGRNPGTIRAAVVAMEPIMSFALVPLSVASLITGLIMSLGTPWGLFRHYWVLAKLLLTVFAVLVMLSQTEPVSYMANLAANPGVDPGRLTHISQLLHPGLGVLVLLVIVVLSVFKPRGMTRYGWRKQQGKRVE